MKKKQQFIFDFCTCVWKERSTTNLVWNIKKENEEKEVHKLLNTSWERFYLLF